MRKRDFLLLAFLPFAGCGTKENAENNFGKPIVVFSLTRPDQKIALSWSSRNTRHCTCTGDWNGVRGIAGTDTLSPPATGTALLTFTLSCAGPKGTVSRTLSVADSVPKVTVRLKADYLTVPAGVRPMLSWATAGANTCEAAGSWTGSKAPQGRESLGPIATPQTFTLVCRGPEGEAADSVRLRPAAAVEPESGLDFPSNGDTPDDVRFLFTDAALNPMYPATYVWRVKLRRQTGYYTTFFWGPNGPYNGKYYYGCHPYPDGKLKPSSRDHKWELSIDGLDVVDDANGHSTRLGYDRWTVQALRAYDDGTGKVHEFYWDLPDTTKVIRVRLRRAYGSPPSENPALSFGDAPWAQGGERLSGVLRGIQIYARNLEVGALLAEMAQPLSTKEGTEGIWYLNINPTPEDISDRSGKGHHPHWASKSRASLWTGSQGETRP